MSFEIKESDFTVIKHIRDWQPRPAMKAAMGHLWNTFSETYPGAETGDTWVSFDNVVGRTTIFATPIDAKTPDGWHLLDRLVVKTVLPEGAWQLSDAQIAECNTLATTGALMIDPNTRDLVIVSGVTFPDADGADDGLESLYLPLVSMAAVFHPYCLVSKEGLYWVSSGNDTPYEFEKSNEPSRWGEEDFNQTEMALRQAGIFANGGTTGLAAEFPWDDGGVSWVTGDETSLLTLQSDMPHPNLGNGLFFKLELPEAYSEEHLVELVHHLNRLEVTSADVPPFFGAWCSKLRTGRIAYVGFLPNQAYWPGSVTSISAWLMMRARTVRATIENFTFRGSHPRKEAPSVASSVK